LLNWQSEHKGATAAWRLVGPNTSAVRLDRQFTKSQPQTRALFSPFLTRRLAKSFEYLLAILDGNPWASIANPYFYLCKVLPAGLIVLQSHQVG